MILQKIHEAFSHILYEDGPHLYIDTNTGEKLTSVTSVIKSYQHPFPSYHVSKAIAKRDGVDQQDILDEWKRTGFLGRTRGTILHNYLEDKIYNKSFTINYNHYEDFSELSHDEVLEFHNIPLKLIEQADNFLSDNKLIPIRTELILGNDKVAGQTDLLAYDVEREKYVLLDYKTDKEYLTESKYNKNFKDPISHLSDCNANKYILQLNMYRELLLPVVQVDDLQIVWFCKDNDNYTKIQIPIIDEGRTLLELL